MQSKNHHWLIKTIPNQTTYISPPSMFVSCVKRRSPLSFLNLLKVAFVLTWRRNLSEKKSVKPESRLVVEHFPPQRLKCQCQAINSHRFTLLRFRTKTERKTSVFVKVFTLIRTKTPQKRRFFSSFLYKYGAV